jgi:prolactin regulatory element-binding protein
MRARHSLHSLPAVPVYSAAFLAKDLLAVGGGGGVSKSGINNKLVRFLNSSTQVVITYSMPQRLYTVNDERSIALLDEFQLQSGEDAPMSMAADTEVRIY